MELFYRRTQNIPSDHGTVELSEIQEVGFNVAAISFAGIDSALEATNVHAKSPHFEEKMLIKIVVWIVSSQRTVDKNNDAHMHNTNHSYLTST